jgi:hypothetical protein
MGETPYFYSREADFIFEKTQKRMPSQPLRLHEDILILQKALELLSSGVFVFG